MENRFENFTVTVLKLNKLIQKIKQYEMKAYGLKAVHVMCLYYLNLNKGGLTASRLAKITLEDKAAVSRALTLLRQKGLVSYAPDGYNERVFLTKDGEKASAYILERADEAVNAAGGTLSEEQRENMYRALGIVTERLEEHYRALTGGRG